MTRDGARKRARRAQLAAGALVVGAVGLLALPVSGVLTPPLDSKPPVDPSLEVIARAPAPPELGVDVDRATTVLVATGVEPKPPPAIIEDEPMEQARPLVELDPEETDGGGWKFIGVMRSPTTAYAVVRVGESQHIVKQGDTLDGSTLARVTEDHLMVRDAGGIGERRIPRADPEVQWASTPLAPRPIVVTSPANGKPLITAAANTQRENRIAEIDERRRQAAAARAARMNGGANGMTTPPGRPGLTLEPQLDANGKVAPGAAKGAAKSKEDERR